jgi:hypothetical protein
MNAITEYKSMLKREYIDEETLSNLNAPEIKSAINSLYRDLGELDNQIGGDIKKVLIIMTKLYCYRLVCNMKVVGSVVPDAKDPDNKYAQARGAVKGLTKKRMWVSYYLGPVAKYLGRHGNLIPIRIERDGKVPIIKKTIEKLLLQINEL